MITISVPALALLGAGQSAPATPELKIDPLLLAEAAEVFERIARDDSPIWPGWNARSTPILFYLPGVQDALVNHPGAAGGFTRVVAAVPRRLDADLRDGATLLVLDGRTSTDERRHDARRRRSALEPAPAARAAPPIRVRRRSARRR
jgi:hypothetical protein